MTLEISFADKLLRQLCENEAIAKRKLGTKVAEKLKRRLADLRAATCIKDLATVRPYELEGIHQKQIALDLCDDYRIVLCANHNSVPLLDSGAIDWSMVNRVKILRIEGTHD
jgi:proteic killer suppression protein